MTRRDARRGSQEIAWALLLVLGGATNVWAEERLGISGPPSSLQEKMEQVQQRIPRWVAEGGNQLEILPLGQQVDDYLKTEQFQHAEDIVDRILAIVRADQTDQTPAAIRTNVQSPKWIRPLGNAETAHIGSPRAVQLGRIPSAAALICWSTRGVVNPRVLGPSNLFVMDASGGHVTQLTFEPQPYEHAAVSPDRRYVAVSRTMDARGYTGLFLLDLGWRTETRLVPEFLAAAGGGMDWDRTGFLYFAGQRSARERQEVFKIHPDGTNLTRLTAIHPSLPGFESDVSVSEDGSLVAYVRMVPVRSGTGLVGKAQIWVMKADGTGQRMVDDGGPEAGVDPSGPIGDYDPEISPDNAFVVFSRTNPHAKNFRDTLNTAHDLWVAPLDRSQPARRLTSPGPISIAPDWHNGAILYTEYDDAGRSVGLVTISPAGSGKRRLETGLLQLWDGARHGKWFASP